MAERCKEIESVQRISLSLLSLSFCVREKSRNGSGTMQRKIDESIFISCLITEIAPGLQLCIYSYTDTDTSNVHKVIIHFDDVEFKEEISPSLFICKILLSLSMCSCMHVGTWYVCVCDGSLLNILFSSSAFLRTTCV